MSPRLHIARPLLGLGLLALALSGCSSPEKSEITVARVEDREITLEYFERKMNTMDPQYVPPNIDTQAAREELLDVMVNKEVMALKAEELGMDVDGSADQQADMVARLKAVQRMREDVVADAKTVSDDEVYDYYEMFPRKLTVSYMLFDYEEDAIEARQLVEGGERWNEVAKRLDAGAPNTETNSYSLTLSYGNIVDDLEYAVFQLPVGQISQPIDSIYGWFLVRVEEVKMERVEPLEEIRDLVVQSVRKQKEALAMVDFIEQVFEKYDLTINDEAIKVIYEHLPDDMPLSPPTPKEDLPAIDIPSEHYDMVLMSYHDTTMDLQEYESVFNESSVFVRPRHDRGVGNFRRALKEQAIRDLMPIEAEAQGYLDDPVVQDEYKLRREQAMVTRLHNELIKDQARVPDGAVAEYWAEHSDEWKQPELRRLSAIVTDNEADAISATIDVRGGMLWSDAVAQYCIASDVREQRGDLGLRGREASDPFTEIGFSLAETGEISSPVEIRDGNWAIVRLDETRPPQDPTLEDVQTQVGMRVKAIAEEELFQEKVEEWRSEYRVETFPEHLMKAVYDPQDTRQTMTMTAGR